MSYDFLAGSEANEKWSKRLVSRFFLAAQADENKGEKSI
jgi:hypothetical protein